MIPTLDLDAAVIKSDIAISSELKQALRIGAALLEDIPERLRDWHPGSDGKVLDLIHPSLFPLIYGRSRVLSSGSVELQQCMTYIGKGKIAPTPDDVDVSLAGGSSYVSGTWRNTRPKFWSKAFQWLPCDVRFTRDEVKITSYINNLHPTLHTSLYSVIEDFITKSIPLWNLALSSTHAGRSPRILHEYTDYDYPLGNTPPKEIGDDWETRENWTRTNRILQRPEPRDFEPYRLAEQVNLRKDFGEQGLQVIVKLANIELTAEKPNYDGGSWHVEGQLNERICATSLYYYDSKNVTDSYLAFRHRTDEEDFELKSHDQVFVLHLRSSSTSDSLRIYYVLLA